MRLASVRLHRVGPFDDVTVRFTERRGDDDDDAATRPVTVLFGGDGTGKTTLLSAIALTRPGYALPPLPQARERTAGDEPAYVVAEWALGEDDPERPHALRVASPTAVLDDEPPEVA